ncbi:hypothetical protein FB567DRAFT_439307 [Paraphoma chrysanthemicola]|uniref:HD/PDEase domain-containing protein n=1 Tax=Paraphoma chrysanthemicola TaxID=798071 RepID=A0A8K0R7U1_9PLEO|nr:hypothetical protein FB567DRAFT_439307 [Paraphoma chrysanthemicola]
MSHRLSKLFSNKTALDSAGNRPHSSQPTLAGGDSEVADNSRNLQIFDTTKLGIPNKYREMFKTVNLAVMDYMYGPVFDASHDYEHIQRVVSLAYQLYQEHKHDHWARGLDQTVMYVACMVHDVGDAKYHVREEHDNRDQEDIIRDFLKANGCKDPLIYATAAYVAARVSFTRELNDPEEAKNNVETYPALRIVQDADRLDGLGAIGIGRCFVFGGINEERRKDTIHTGVELHYDRFQKYLDFMKTKKGREMAQNRWEVMDKSRQHWAEETDCSAVL